MTLSRRRLLSLLSLAPGLALRGDQRSSGLIIRSANPEDFEMPLEGFDTWLTPAENFYVRTHIYKPKVELADWRVKVDGLVERELTLDMAELKKLPRVEQVAVLECAGNGRAFYEPGVAGMQWRVGAVGNAQWTGVRLADVLKRAGVKPGAQQVLFNGADIPMGKVPDFVRTVPLEKALHPDTLLAFDMNGAPLPASHGFPLRLVPCGWAGDSWVKWVTNITLRDQEFDGFFMKTAYRRPMHTVAPGTAVDPAAMTPVTAIKPKSVISSPLAGQRLATGPVTIRGAAWAGESPVARVDVSTDSGRTWRPAKLGADRARYAWRLWEASWSPPGEGSYVLMAKTTDERGDTQPFLEDWNPSGYLWNVVPAVRVEVGGGAPGLPAQAAAAEVPALPDKVKGTCVGCHGQDMIAGQHLTRAQWEREVDKMTRWGADVKPDDRADLVDFLTKAFGK
ncbi:MAG TPA: molybdopterin-dependent oxidoreductase [Bryobacteraceae bacterium]|nr:molybdopterin-dependent oxidoreductase [Bryobacteraceae bacterium]